MKKPKLLSPVLMTVVMTALAGCGGGSSGNDPAVDDDAGNGDDGVISQQIDASAGGRGAANDDPANKYTYFNLATNAVVELTDAEAATSSAWHIGFKRTNFKLNGGVSGPGSVKAVTADAQDDFYDSDGEPDNSVFLNASETSERMSFDAVTSITTEDLSYEEDRNIPYINGDGSSKGWWLYAGPPTHAISANPAQWWLIKSAAANSYAKFNVSNIVQTSRDITLDLYIQGVAESEFSTTLTQWTAAIGAAGGSQCFDIDSIMEVDCTTAASAWDIKVEVVDQSWNIWTNGGVSGSGSGGAFGAFDNTEIVAYVSGTTGPSGSDITRMYGQDSVGGVFKNNTWYAYNLADNSKLWPNYRVYVIATDTTQYKLQVLSFYNEVGTSGIIKFRYQSL